MSLELLNMEPLPTVYERVDIRRKRTYGLRVTIRYIDGAYEYSGSEIKAALRAVTLHGMQAGVGVGTSWRRMNSVGWSVRLWYPAVRPKEILKKDDPRIAEDIETVLYVVPQAIRRSREKREEDTRRNNAVRQVNSVLETTRGEVYDRAAKAMRYHERMKSLNAELREEIQLQAETGYTPEHIQSRLSSDTTWEPEVAEVVARLLPEHAVALTKSFRMHMDNGVSRDDVFVDEKKEEEDEG